MKTAEWNALRVIASQTAAFGNSSRSAIAWGGGKRCEWISHCNWKKDGSGSCLSFSLFAERDLRRGWETEIPGEANAVHARETTGRTLAPLKSHPRQRLKILLLSLFSARKSYRVMTERTETTQKERV